VTLELKVYKDEGEDRIDKATGEANKAELLRKNKKRKKYLPNTLSRAREMATKVAR